MSEAVRSHPLVLPYLDAAGAFEQAIVWTDSETGIRCKARPDWLIPDARLLIDLKTTVTIDGRRFGSAAAKYGYHCQLAHYSNGIRAALGWEPFRRLVVAVEKAAPYDVAVFELDPEALFAAEEEVRELLKRLHICRLTNHWPGRYTEEQALQLPAWVTMDDDDASAEALGLDMED